MQTQYTFKPSSKFAAVATAEEIAQIRVYPLYNEIYSPLTFKKKADVKRFTDAGFKVENYSARIWILSKDNELGTIETTTIGPMVYIHRVEEKYNDNDGAYQVAYGVDADGNEMTECNRYDYGSCYIIGPITA